MSLFFIFSKNLSRILQFFGHEFTEFIWNTSDIVLLPIFADHKIQKSYVSDTMLQKCNVIKS